MITRPCEFLIFLFKKAAVLDIILAIMRALSSRLLAVLGLLSLRFCSACSWSCRPPASRPFHAVSIHLLGLRLFTWAILDDYAVQLRSLPCPHLVVVGPTEVHHLCYLGTNEWPRETPHVLSPSTNYNAFSWLVASVLGTSWAPNAHICAPFLCEGESSLLFPRCTCMQCPIFWSTSLSSHLLRWVLGKMFFNHQAHANVYYPARDCLHFVDF